MTTPDTKSLAGPNVLLMGPAGTGKTDSLGSLADAGIEIFYLDLENGLESLLGHWTRQGKPIPANVHWHKIAPPKRSLKDMIDNSNKILTLDAKTLANINDPNRHKYNLFVKIQEALCDFPDDRTGQKFGPVETWGVDRALCIDGLTGFCAAGMSMMVGGKPIRSQQDWGMAQDQVEIMLRMLCDQVPCWFVLIAHVEREVDQVLGGVKLMPSALGKALPPKIPPMFSDVILTVREGTKWTWDTASGQADVKARNLPWQAGQNQDFAAIVKAWRSRQAAIAASGAQSAG